MGLSPYLEGSTSVNNFRMRSCVSQEGFHEVALACATDTQISPRQVYIDSGH